MLFSVLWSVAKHFVDESLSEAVTIITSFEDLTEYVDLQYLPDDIGGDCTFEPDVDTLTDISIEEYNEISNLT